MSKSKQEQQDEESAALIDKQRDDQEEQDDYADATCCLCFSLKTGATILAVFSILGLIQLIPSAAMIGLAVTRTLGVLLLCAQVPQIVATFFMVKWLFNRDD